MNARPTERGTALLLMPATFLILLILGSIALDFGLLHTRQREIEHLADGAANDAASYAVDLERLRSDGCVALRPELAAAAAEASVASSGIADVELDSVEFSIIDGLPSVIVQVSVDADLVLSPALPSGTDVKHLEAEATASLFDADADFVAC